MTSNSTLETKITFKQKRKQDAMALAELVYKMFKEAEENAKINRGNSNE